MIQMKVHLILRWWRDNFTLTMLLRYTYRLDETELTQFCHYKEVNLSSNLRSRLGLSTLAISVSCHRIVFIIWLWFATVPSGQDGAILPARDTRFVPQGKFGVLSHIINSLLTLARSRCLDIGLILFCVFMDLDFASVHKHVKNHLANIQSSGPHAWSITHIYLDTPQSDQCPSRNNSRDTTLQEKKGCVGDHFP